MDIARLQYLAHTPRQNLKELCVKPSFFSRKKRMAWEEDMRHGPLVLTSVVQASRKLYDPSNDWMAPAVIIFTTDPARRLDGRWLSAVKEQLLAVKQHPQLGDHDLLMIQKLLIDEHSEFDIALPPRLTWGVPTTMKVTELVPDLLPGKCIPPHHLVPGIVTREGHIYELKPSAYM